MGFILSTISIFFRDMFYIYGVILTLWTYATPIFYDISMLNPTVQNILKWNPLYMYIDFARTIILHNQMPSLNSFIMCALSSIIILILGVFVFRKKQDQFIYYV
jgi:ABC-2 type transport system permease protein